MVVQKKKKKLQKKCGDIRKTGRGTGTVRTVAARDLRLRAAVVPIEGHGRRLLPVRRRRRRSTTVLVFFRTKTADKRDIHSINIYNLHTTRAYYILILRRFSPFFFFPVSICRPFPRISNAVGLSRSRRRRRRRRRYLVDLGSPRTVRSGRSGAHPRPPPLCAFVGTFETLHRFSCPLRFSRHPQLGIPTLYISGASFSPVVHKTNCRPVLRRLRVCYYIIIVVTMLFLRYVTFSRLPSTTVVFGLFKIFYIVAMR